MKTQLLSACSETYDLAADMKKDGPHAEILEFTIEHCTGKRVREK